MRNMNYNVKRFTQPLKGLCSCNYAAVKSIGNLVNDNIEYRQYNKGFFIRQLGEVMERIEHGEDHAIIEPVIQPELTMAKMISELSPSENPDASEIGINFYDDDVVNTGGFLLVLNADGLLVSCHIINIGRFLTVDANEIPVNFTQPLTDRFVAAVERRKPVNNDQAMDYISQPWCNYDANHRYLLYGFTL